VSNTSPGRPDGGAADGPAVNGSGGVPPGGEHDGAPGAVNGAADYEPGNAPVPQLGGVTWQPDGRVVYGYPRPAPGGMRPGNPLASRIGRAAGWIFMDAASARFGTLLTGLVLARIVGPSELGAFGVAVVVLLGAQSIGQLGVGSALAVWRGAPQQLASTVTTIALAASAAVYAACYVGAPALAAAMGAPGVTSVIRVVALNVVISGAVAAPRAMVQRRAPRTRVLVEQADNWVGVVVTIGLVTGGHGLMGFAIGRVAGALVSAVLFIIFAPSSFRFGFHRPGVGALLRTALPLGVSAAFTFVITNADQIVVGLLLQTRFLGYYVLALCLASWPITMFSQQVRDVAPVAFARFRRGPQVVSSAFLSSANLVAAVTLPTCVLISTLAAPLVQLAYGSVWAPAAPVLAWLAPLATLRVFYVLANDYFAVLAPTRRSLIFQMMWLVVLVPALVAGARWDGILGVAVAQVAVAVLFLVPWYLTELRPRANWPGLPLGRFAFPLAVAAGVGVIIFGARRLVPDARLDVVIGASAALGAVALLVFRLRTVFIAVRRAAAGSGRRPGRVADILGPALAVTIEPPIYPVSAPILPRGLGPVAEPAEGELGRKVRAGARWSMLNTIVVRISNFLVGVLLARTVFGPTEWGLYAVSQIVLAILLSANELGVSAAIVRWDGDIRSFCRTVFTLSVASSTLIYVALFATAPQIARMLGSPSATGMLRVLCITVIIDGFNAVPLALLTREFAQGRRMLVDTLNFAVSTGVTLWLAFSGHGVISFAWGSVAGCTVALIVASVAAPYVPRPGWNTQDARQLLQFGLPLAGASLLALGVLNVDSAIVGATLGAAMLGLYQLAFNISSWPVNSISQAASRVSFAGFSRVADSRAALADAFTRAMGLVMAITVPACVLLATLARPLIHTIYGERWVPAAPALSFLALLGLMRVAEGLMYDGLAVSGRRNTLMGVQALWLVALVPVLLIGARLGGITGVSIGHVVVAAGIVGPVFLRALSKAGIPARSIARACLRPFLGGALMAVVSLLVIRYAGDGLAGLAAAICASAAVYLPIAYPMRKLLRTAPEPADAPTAADVPAPQGRHRRRDVPERHTTESGRGAGSLD
jgi:O-antigen/teichoic acid export membrane protein